VSADKRLTIGRSSRGAAAPRLSVQTHLFAPGNGRGILTLERPRQCPR
jgi:hypothetical protein